MQRFEGKVAVVTGGASGIGEAIVRGLLSDGARVTALDINASLLTAKQNEFGGAFIGIPCDVGDEPSVSRAMNDCADHFGGLDLAFNVAGGNKGGPVIEHAGGDWDFTHNLCLKGVFLSMKHEARLMRPNAVGAIVNISSVTAHIPVRGLAAYCSAKVGVEMLTKVAALEFAEFGIRVNVVLPGHTDTPFTRATKDNPKFAKAWMSSIPMGREARPDEIAKPALFLASADASYVSGASLVVDGGWELTGIPDVRRILEQT